jgi:DNA-binding transcriptional regulator YbjK
MEGLAGTDTRERIMRTTLDLIGQEGMGAVTNRRVATAAGTSLGSLTYHFESQHDLLRESLLLFVSEEVEKLEGLAAGLRDRRPGVEQAAIEIERVLRETGERMHGLVEIELHTRAARDPALQDASRRCFEAYEELATASLEILEVPDPERQARTVVALLYGLALRRLGTGDEDVSGTAEALLAVAQGAQAADQIPLA